MAVADSWIIYAVFGVLVCLLLWWAATQWNVNRQEAGNLRASLTVLGVVALAFVVWQRATVRCKGRSSRRVTGPTVSPAQLAICNSLR